MPLPLVILLILHLSPQSPPNWIGYETRNLMYPESEYFVGFSSRYYTEKEDVNEILKEVKHLSRMELSESVFVSVSSQSTLTINTANEATETTFEKNSVTKSALETFGMKTETYLDEAKKVAYGFSFVKKRTLATGYFKQFSKLMSQLKTLIRDSGQEPDAEKKYVLLTKAMQLLHETDNLENILVFLGINDDLILSRADRQAYKSYIREEFRTIRSSENQSMGQRVQYMLDDMANEIKNKEVTFMVTPVAYKNTGIPSEFSAYFHQILKAKASSLFQVTEKPDSKFRMTGSYWPAEEEIRMTFNLHEYDGDEPMFMLFGGSFNIPLSEIDELGVDYEIKKEGVDLKQHYDILNQGLKNGGMNATISTQKGTRSLIFHEGEPMNLFVHVTRPSYLRLINVWSDGTQLSLLDNYYIQEDETNQNTELPFGFEAACPCGTEYIVLLAQSEPFEEMVIRQEDGFDFIEGYITEVLKTTRSYQQRKLAEEGFYFSESGFSITTLPVSK